MQYFRTISIEDEEGRQLYTRREEVDADHVIEIIIGFEPTAKAVSQPARVKAGKKEKTCRICGKPGHTKRSCPDVENAGGVPTAESRSKLKSIFDKAKKKGRSRVTPEMVEKAQQLRAQGLNLREIGEKIGMAMSSVHKMLADASGVKKKPERGSNLSQETIDRILEMRKDGNSAAKIEVELGIGRAIVARQIRAAGITDRSGAPDERYPLRCAKCGSKDHMQSQCPNGDALDQLDAAEGYVESKRDTMTVDKFQQVKIATSHDVPQDVIAHEMSLAIEEVQHAILARTYTEYSAAK